MSEPGDKEVAPTVERIVAEVLRVDAEAVTPDAVFGEDLPAESLDYVEIAERVESEVGVHVPDEALAEFETVGDVTAYVAERT